ncbi:hypothetical protein TTHERM_01141490 (macronuclear) [Tetrahymena thermophila SB210]|uniref:Mono(ADP-ribosyl)transferase n=1 Tax=Tetrahymena thermophila (strain SB210) TaxID=312017 RepID=Q22B00_TETTS|nr:hypothetical protein TTHERM_01141490 [Tetrahymena thermophila SB210]EAR82458.2 hypothetical protein TTHERM_01141490 [Tetrahymena thermophila SB210]|eukprot:XP_001030121.2 hypothetical protein TTHERM_01141490 [Tetrahymena thermophila SB210]
MSSFNSKIQQIDKYIEIDEVYMKNHSDIFNRYRELEVNIDQIIKMIYNNDKNMNPMKFFRILESQNLLILLFENLIVLIKPINEQKFKLLFNKFMLLFDKFKAAIKNISKNLEDTFRTDQIIPYENVLEVKSNLIKTYNELITIKSEIFCSQQSKNQNNYQLNKSDQNILESEYGDLFQKKQQMEKIVDQILKKFQDDKSIHSRQCMQILEQLNLLKPLFQNFDDSIKDINEEKLIQFYKSFQKIFKRFETNTKNASQIMEDTFSNGKISNEKIQQIKQCVLSTKNDLLSIQKGIFTISQKYLIWIDYNLKDFENQKCLKEINLICDRVMNVVAFDKDLDFRQFVKNEQEHILYLIMSGKAAGERPGDGQNLKWIKQLIQEKQGYQFVYGIFIFASNNNEQQYFTPLLESDKGLILSVTQSQQTIQNNIKDIVFPKKSLRVIDIKQLSSFLNDKKEEFLDLATKDYSNYNLDDFHPDKPFIISSVYKSISKEIRERFEKKNLYQRLNEAQQIIQECQISIPKYIIEPQEIYDDLKQCFSVNQYQNYVQVDSKKRNQEVAIKILKLYTRESCFYQFVNSLLSILNQDLLIVLWDIVLCLRISLSIFNDEVDSQIFKPYKQEGQVDKVRSKLNLYRGTAIPQEVFNSIYKIGQIICMCGFSSFSSEISVAYFFSKKGQGIKVIFEFLYECGTDQFSLRPRYLDKISECPGEKEYLLNCGSVFRIINIYEKIDKQVKYTFVQLKI